MQSPRCPCPLSHGPSWKALPRPHSPGHASGGILPASGPRSRASAPPVPCSRAAPPSMSGWAREGGRACLGAGDTCPVPSRARVVPASVCHLDSDRTPPRCSCVGTALCGGWLWVTGGARAPGEKQQLPASATSLAAAVPIQDSVERRDPPSQPPAEPRGSLRVSPLCQEACRLRHVERRGRPHRDGQHGGDGGHQ